MILFIDLRVQYQAIGVGCIYDFVYSNFILKAKVVNYYIFKVKNYIKLTINTLPLDKNKRPSWS